MDKLTEDIDSIVKELSCDGGIDFKSLFNSAKYHLDNWVPVTNQNEGLIDVIDFFSGCGGMSLGFSALSQKFNLFNLKGAIDINKKALESYELNFKTKTLTQDIRELCNEDGPAIVRQKFNLSLKKERPLVIIGCAPCQGFSAHTKVNWDKHDDRNTLIGAFVDTALKLEPDFIVMENVPEILGKKYWKHYNEAREILKENGYNIKQAIYNCASFGVPQARFRAVILASKKEFDLPSPIFNQTEFVTVREAIGSLPPVKAGEVHNSDAYHRSAKHNNGTIETIKCVPKDGGSRPTGVGPACLDKVKGFYDVYGRLSWSRPAITLTQYARNPASGRFTHPEQDRGLTIREAARLQSFPDSYQFQGSLDHCFKQIGESVPPLLSLAVAVQIMIDFSSIKIKQPIEEPVLYPESNLYSSEITSIKSKSKQHELHLY